MTNREAIEILKTERNHMIPTLLPERIEAIDMAISALQAQDLQPTCNQLATDTISRQAAIDALEKVATLFPWKVPGNRDSYDRYNEAWNDAIGRAEIEIEELPSAQPETARRIVGKSRDGMTLWYQCDMCNEQIDKQDVYCCGCGRKFVDE